MLRRFILFLVVCALGLSACGPVEPPPGQPSNGAAVATATPLSPDLPVSATPLPPGASPPPAELPLYAPQPGDGALTRGPVFLDDRELLILESYPPQIVLRLSGSLPNPCYQLRVAVAPPDALNRIQIDAYSLVAGDQICIEVLKALEQSVPLGTFASGHYTVWVNGELIGEFDA